MPIADQQDSKSTAKTVDAPQWLSRLSIKLFISYAHRDEETFVWSSMITSAILQRQRNHLRLARPADCAGAGMGRSD